MRGSRISNSELVISLSFVSQLTAATLIMTSILKVPGIEKLSAGDLAALTSTASLLGIEPDWLATVISFETAGTFSPSIVNRAGSGAFGLIQFMPSTAQNILGTATREEAVNMGRAMSFSEQLRRMVIPYFKGRKMTSLEDVYLAVFYPAAMNKPASYVIGTAPGAVYTQNAGFDAAKKGYITREDVTRKLRYLFESAGGRVPVKTMALAQVTFGVAIGAGLIWMFARKQLEALAKDAAKLA